MNQRETVRLSPNNSGIAIIKELPAAPSTISEVMTRNVVTLSCKHTFQEAIGLMANRPFRHFLVVEEDRRLVGVISDRDLLRILARTPDWQKTTVGEVMGEEPITVEPETPLSVAVGVILKHRINCLPVVDENMKMLGIVTSTDLLKTYIHIQGCLERIIEVGMG